VGLCSAWAGSQQLLHGASVSETADQMLNTNTCRNEIHGNPHALILQLLFMQDLCGKQTVQRQVPAVPP
jgi:hypothetical protein